MRSEADMSFEQIRNKLNTIRDNNIILPCNSEMHPFFFAVLRFLKLKKKSVTLETNGRIFCYKDVCKKTDGLLDRLNFNFFGDNSRIHDLYTRTSGSFFQASRGLANARFILKKTKISEFDWNVRLPSLSSSCPSEVVLEITSRCNFRCRRCFNKTDFAKQGRHLNSELSTRHAEQIIDSVAGAGVSRIRFSGGEPFLRDDLLHLIRYAKAKGLEVWLNTNGSLLTASIVKEIERHVANVLLPFNGYDAASDSKWTGVSNSFELKLRGVRLLRRSRIKVLRAGTVAVPDNISNLESICKLVMENKFDSWETYRPIHIKRLKNPAFDVNALYRKLVKLSFEYKKNFTIANSVPFCSYNRDKMNLISAGAVFDDGHSRIIVGPSGKAKPSYFIQKDIGDSNGIIGCWNSDFMRKMRNLEFVPKECQGCTYIGKCRGGSRYMAKLYSGDYGGMDPLMEHSNPGLGSSFKRILLLNCPDVNGNIFPPLGIATLASYLGSKGYRIHQDDLNIKLIRHNREKGKKIDLRIFNNYAVCRAFLKGEISGQQIESAIERIVSMSQIKGFYCIGLSVDLGNLFLALLLARYIKQRTGAIIVIGGRQMSTLSNNRLVQLIKELNIDYVDYFIQGKAQTAFENLLDSDFEGFSQVISSSEFEKKPEKDVMLPKPEYDNNYLGLYRFKLRELHNYVDQSYLPIIEKMREHSEGSRSLLILPHKLSIGCAFNCAFCENSYWKKKPQYHDIETIRLQLESLSRRHRTKYFSFYDSEINCDMGFVDSFCNMAKDLDIFWGDSASLLNLGPRTVSKLKEAGALHLVYGFETGSERLRYFLNKRISNEAARKVLLCSSKTGIWNSVDLIQGLPYESQKDLNKTICFIKENKAIVDTYHVGPFQLRPSDFSLNPAKYGLRLLGEDFISSRLRKIHKFDELNGLDWKRKKSWIQNSFKLVTNAVKHNYRFNIIDEKVLFFLFDIFGEKSIIKKRIHEI